MINSLPKLLRLRGLSDGEVREHTAELGALILFSILQNADTRLDTSERELLWERMAEGKFYDVLPVLENKYAESDFEQMLEQTVAPLLDSYLKEVLQLQV